MYCPNCGAFSQPGAKFCYNCGRPLAAAAPAPLSVPVKPETPVQPEPLPRPESEPAAPVKKGSHLVPLLILLGMSLLGLVLFFTVPLDPNSGNAAGSSDTPWFYMEDGTLYFDETLYSGPSELTVPEQINGETVLRLGEYCFAYSADLTSVILPDTLTEIGESAFAGSGALRGIQIPESVTVIGKNAFQDCIALEAIHIPAGVEEIGAYAFRRCSSLDYIFYDGTFESWQALYDAKVNPNTTVYCIDGNFPLG